jgi:hypothetical protein
VSLACDQPRSSADADADGLSLSLQFTETETTVAPLALFLSSTGWIAHPPFPRSHRAAEARFAAVDGLGGVALREQQRPRCTDTRAPARGGFREAIH